jgi:hypothetical protein
VEVLDLVLDLVLELEVGRHRPLGGVGVLERALALLLAVVVVAAVALEGVAGGEDRKERADLARVGERRRVGKGLDGVSARAQGLADLDERVDHLEGESRKLRPSEGQGQQSRLEGGPSLK